MWKPENCDFCGDCLEACKYVDYDHEKAVREITGVVKGEVCDILNECITCGACNQYCVKGANPFDLIIRRIEETRTGLWRPDAYDDYMWKQPIFKPTDEEIKKGKPWMSLCTMKPITPTMFVGRLFDDLNLVGGVPYYCWMGYIHAGVATEPFHQLKSVIDNLNALPTDEIIFYHDECLSTIWTLCPDLGLRYNFKPIHILEYMIDYVKKNYKDVRKLGFKIAYHPSDSQRFGPSREEWLDELFDLIGVTRVARKYDRLDQLCCSVPVIWRDRLGDAERGLEIRLRNVNDAVEYGASHMIYICPFCYFVLKGNASAAGLKPLMIEDLVKMAFGEVPTNMWGGTY